MKYFQFNSSLSGFVIHYRKLKGTVSNTVRTAQDILIFVIKFCIMVYFSIFILIIIPSPFNFHVLGIRSYHYITMEYKLCEFNVWISHPYLTQSPPGQNGRHFADDVSICIFMNEKLCIWIRISLKFAPKGSIGNKPPGTYQATGHYLNQCYVIHWRSYVALVWDELRRILWCQTVGMYGPWECWKMDLVLLLAQCHLWH